MNINVREHLINAALNFVEQVSQMDGIIEISLIGSITTSKQNPKDIDLIVKVNSSVDFAKLAMYGRKLKGKSQNINSGADIFIIDENKKYLGRTCSWKECRPYKRMACKALNCGNIPHLYDDFTVFNLRQEFIDNVPIILFPKVIFNRDLPTDLTENVGKRLVRENRLARECAKLDCLEEQTLADEGLAFILAEEHNGKV